MPLTAVVLDHALLAAGSEARRAEWQLAIQELIEDNTFRLPSGDVALHIVHNRTGTRLMWLDADESPSSAAVHIPDTVLGPHLREYVAICTTMVGADQGPASASIEALDMAKKVAHDAAARTLASYLAPLMPDLATCRRLFTLLLTIHVDTTALGAYHLGHLPR